MSARVCTIAVLLGLAAVPSQAYSVLTHEAVVDTVWDTSFKPVLMARFPGLTADQLLEAHAYAYGGAIIQDMGYYPFGNKLFSDLVHYVRSGDFVLALLKDAKDPDQLAFALGALCHYVGDNFGHPVAVNRAVPLLYPKLRQKFGPVVTYEDNTGDHIKTEFGFDVIEVARGNYAPKAYHDFIGFHVSKPLLEQAFSETYGIPLTDVVKNLDLALGTFRRTVSGLIPEMTRAAWAEKKDDIGRSVQGVTRRRFVYNLSRASYEKEWGKSYARPGIGAHILAFFIRILPKIGPLRALGFKVPPPEAEKMLMASFNDTVARLRELAKAEQGHRQLSLPDRNLDTGGPVLQGSYRLADEAYAKLLEKLADTPATVPPELRASILDFYKKSPAGLSDKAQRELTALRAGATAAP